jgi:kynurenine 3-monooxygenase
VRLDGQSVEIVGGGLVGSLLSVFLARRGCAVRVHERRADPRSGQAEGGRSINLVITERGFHALRQVGLEQGARGLTTRVLGRMMHSLTGEQTFQPYGRDETEANYSISRADLNRHLIDAAEREGVRFAFQRRLTTYDVERGRLTLADEATRQTIDVEAPIVFGADGGGSAVRDALMRLPGAQESVEPLSHGYKELEIPADKKSSMAGDALHIWPRGQIMLMALPNRDGSFTVTLYLPHAGKDGFDSLTRPADVQRLFATQFTDAAPLIPSLEQTFLANPTGHLGTVRCAPWYSGGRALLVGDAAHAIVPFFGQGMNCGFEDCTVLDALLDRTPAGDWEAAFREFYAARKPDCDAIAEMALENFVEMRDRVGDPAFLLRKRVEHLLEVEHPSEYRSRYALVMYSRIPYRLAQQAGEIQAQILDELCAGLNRVDDVDRARALDLVRSRLTPFLVRHSIRF